MTFLTNNFDHGALFNAYWYRYVVEYYASTPNLIEKIDKLDYY